MISRRLQALGWAALAIVVGLVWRLAPLHLPAFAYKYGGSMLYAAMIYWLLVAGFPRARVARVAASATLLCFVIEAFKLVHRPALDAFRMTLAGKLLLGRVFTVGALLAYAAAVCLVASLDSVQRTARSRSLRDEKPN